MAINQSFPWNSTTPGQAGPYTDSEFAVFLDTLIGNSYNGVVHYEGNELAVTASSVPDKNVNVGTGACLIEGRWAYNDTSQVIAIADNTSGNPRIDAIILRVTFASQTVEITKLQGSPAVSPTTPILTQNGTTWEVYLASVAVANGFTTITSANITDLRGWVSGLFQIISPILSNTRLGIGETNPQSKVHISSSTNANATGVTNYQLFISRNSTSTSEGPGIGFGSSTDSPNTNVGAAIVHIRTGGNSAGDLVFKTKSGTGTGDATLERMRITSTGNVGIGVQPQHRLHIANSSATNNTVDIVLRIDNDYTPGATTTGFGTGIRYVAKTSVQARILADVSAFWSNATDASRIPVYVISVLDAAGTRTGLRISSSGSAPTIGLYGTTETIQYATTGTTTGFTAGAGTTVVSGSTFTGNTGATAYTIGDVVRALKLIGLIAS